jgi:hypothetical protein
MPPDMLPDIDVPPVTVTVLSFRLNDPADIFNEPLIDKDEAIDASVAVLAVVKL